MSIINIIHIKCFLVAVLITFCLGFIVPFIIIRRRGKNPQGTNEGYRFLARLSGLSIFLWFICVIFYLVFTELFNLFWIIPFLSSDIIVVVGMIVILVGFIFELVGILVLGINFRIELPKEETELVSNGIYRLMRNPIVFGVHFLQIGTFLILPNVLTLIITILNIVTFDAKVGDEERFLLKRFGNAFIAYKNKVGRYLPFKIKKDDLRCDIK